MPEEGKPKPPNTPSNPRVGARLQSAGNRAGVEFTGLCGRAPNTVKAHCLLKYVLERHGATLQHAVQERLFKAYFRDGLYPDVATLVSLASEFPELDTADVQAHLESRTDEAEVRAQAASFSRRGVNGVPFFIVNSRPAFSGAQPAESFVEAFQATTK